MRNILILLATAVHTQAVDIKSVQNLAQVEASKRFKLPSRLPKPSAPKLDLPDISTLPDLKKLSDLPDVSTLPKPPTVTKLDIKVPKLDIKTPKVNTPTITTPKVNDVPKVPKNDVPKMPKAATKPKKLSKTTDDLPKTKATKSDVPEKPENVTP